MKDKKKVLLSVLRKQLTKDYQYETQAIELVVKKLDGARDDGWGVIYSKSGKRLIAAKKTLEGHYVVKEDTAEINDKAFWGCAFVERIEVPQTVVKIGDEAFARCLSLDEVNIPASVKELGKNPFEGLDAEVIRNESGNFVLEDGLLYDATRTRLIACLTDAETLTLPETVQTVGSLSFTRRAKLKQVVLPEGLIRIGRDAFSDCEAMEEVTIPASVTTIEPYAFASCDSLRRVVFCGVPHHVARTAFSECDNLTTILVPADGKQRLRKQLHLASDSETVVFVDVKGMDNHPEGKEKHQDNQQKETKK